MRQVLNSVFKDRQVCWYKPVCLLAVLYEIKKGMSPRNIEPAAVMKRLLILAKHVFPDGKWQGHKAWKTNPSAEKWMWQPLCRLTNDGALQFLDQEGQRVDSSIWGKDDLPSAPSKLKQDRVTIAVSSVWECYTSLDKLRDDILDRMSEDTETDDCKLAAKQLAQLLRV